jgi:tRNA A-37 threonylcarbamoyl transferase component Bud32
MCAARSVAARDNLDDLARAAVGGGRRLAGVSRLAGGSKKGAYRLAFDDGFTAVAYLWAGNENYWPVGGDPADPLSGASGVSLFEAAHRELQAAGVRTPRVYLIDRSGRRYPADVAVVEDVPGGSLKTLLDRDPQAAAFPLRRLAEALAAMHSRQSRRYGKVALVRDGGTASGSSCEQVVLDRARTDLAEAARRDLRIGAVESGLESVLDELASQVRPRREYRLIHGELGPEHLLLDRDGTLVIIDIEGLMFFDVEWEHTFLKIRFGEQYQPLQRAGLDERRMALYTLAMCLSLVAGPLRLLDGDFPHRDGMINIVEANIQRTLAFLTR